jgi:hypothetical protein
MALLLLYLPQEDEDLMNLQVHPSPSDEVREQQDSDL